MTEWKHLSINGVNDQGRWRGRESSRSREQQAQKVEEAEHPEAGGRRQVPGVGAWESRSGIW